MVEVKARLKDLPPIPSGLDGTGHTHIIDTHVEGILCDEFPMPKSQPKEDWIIADTKNIFADRAAQWKNAARRYLS